jgi:hypothetical protein
MAGQVLDTLFVDIVTRGVNESHAILRSFTQETEKATAGTRKLRDAITEVGRANQGLNGTLGRGGGGFSNTQVQAQSARPFEGGVYGARPQQNPILPRRESVRENPERWGRQAQAMTPQVRPAADIRVTRPQTGVQPPAAGQDAGGFLSGLKTAGVALAGVTAAAAPFIAMMRQGLQGTVELERFTQSVGQVAREVATLVGPPLRLAADVINGAVSVFRQLGPAGQQLLGVVTGVGVLGQVLNDPAMRGAMNEMGAAFSQLVIASKPLVNQLAYFASALIKAGVVEPMVVFARGLTVAAMMLTQFVTAAERGMQRLGLGFTMKERGKRDELSLNQTGTEDAQGTFARIQESVLKYGQDKEETAQESLLTNIDKRLGEIYTTLGAIAGFVGKVPNMNPSDFAQGGLPLAANAASGLGRAINRMIR